MISHTFIIPGQPVAKGRPRFARVGAGVRAYTPAKSQRWEDFAALCMRSQVGMTLYDEPLVLTGVVVFERPQRLNRKKDTADRIPHTSKPDLDNAAKNFMDALTKGGIVKDDACICGFFLSKWYAAKGEAPHMTVTLSGL